MVTEERNQTKTPKCPTSSVISQDATPHGIGALSPYSIAECLQDMIYLPLSTFALSWRLGGRKKSRQAVLQYWSKVAFFSAAVLPVEDWWLFFATLCIWEEVGPAGDVAGVQWVDLLSSRRPSALPMRLRSSSKSSAGGREYSGQERRC